ncbi:MAG TPA: hypothetical protein DCZ75_17335 [Geobacter sp.]|nr:hypothetical protein [Geobacter sp.]
MTKKVMLQIAAAALLAAPAVAQEVPQTPPPTYNCDFEPACEVAPGIYGKMASPVTSKFKLSFGGFVKLDYIYNSVNLGPTGGTVPSPGIAALGTLQPGGIPKSSSAAGQEDQTLMTARQSRFWIKVDGPALLGAKTGALIEADFFGAGSGNEGANLRMRHAYGTIDWKNTQVLFGQSWDSFGPAAASTLDFGQGATTGNPGSPRVAQIRVTQKVALSENNSLKLIAGVQNPPQDSNTATGAAGETWGGKVNLAGQAMLVSKALGVAPGFWGLPMNSFTAGFFGLYGNQDVAGNAEMVDSWGYGFYTFVPVLKSSDGKSRAMTASFEGQTYMAANMAFAHATAHTLIGPAGDKSPAKGYGLFGQAIFYPTQNLGFTAGYGKRSAYDYGSYAGVANFQKYSSQIFGNVAYDLNAAIRVAVEYQHLKTLYGNNTPGTSDSGTANIARVAAMYFF